MSYAVLNLHPIPFGFKQNANKTLSKQETCSQYSSTLKWTGNENAITSARRATTYWLLANTEFDHIDYN